MGGRADYATYDSGRCERYVIDGFGHRVPWPIVDYENSSYNGEEDQDMIYLESGRVLPRSEWDAECPVKCSSDESVDDRHPVTSQDHRGPRPDTRRARLRDRSSEDDDFDSERPSVRKGHRINRYIVVDQVLRVVGSRSRMKLERDLPMLNHELDASLVSIKIQEESSVDDTGSERSS